jgi:hypothetical protein
MMEMIADDSIFQLEVESTAITALQIRKVNAFDNDAIRLAEAVSGPSHRVPFHACSISFRSAT